MKVLTEKLLLEESNFEDTELDTPVVDEVNPESIETDEMGVDTPQEETPVTDEISTPQTTYKVSYTLGKHSNWSRVDATSEEEAKQTVQDYITSKWPDRKYEFVDIEEFDEEEMSETLNESMSVEYSEETIKSMIKILTSNMEDYKQLLDEYPEDADYWKEQIAKCQNEIDDLTASMNVNEAIAPDGYAPKKVGKAYKVFKIKNGKLYPPMVANPGGKDTPVGVWLTADEGEFAGLSKTGRPQVKSTGSGTLSYRPGWHLGDIPRASQFDRTNKETGEKEFPKDFVWAECEYTMDIDYQPESDEQGHMRMGKDGKPYRSDKYQHSLAGLPKVPKDGYYKYRTNPRPDTVPWVITGAIKVNRLLSDAEVNAILEKNGVAPIHRQGGDKTLQELGLRESLQESVTDVQPIETESGVGMSMVISDLIKDEYEAIDGYNSAIVTAEAEGWGGLVKVLTDIQAEEHIHIGQLQELLKTTDPNADKVEDGQIEGREQLGDDTLTIDTDNTSPLLV
jgi:uncharacterized protein (UPF0305 family)